MSLQKGMEGHQEMRRQERQYFEDTYRQVRGGLMEIQDIRNKGGDGGDEGTV